MKKFVLKKEESAPKPENYTIKYSELLNKQQLDAVFFDRGAALVVAGAGTGKTRTLVYRVARLVEAGVHPSSILLLTFTRRAAQEMISRATNILDDRCKHVKGGTFHYYCSQLLHQYASEIGFPADFTIIDTADALDVIQHVRTQLGLHKKNKRFPNKNTLLSIISSVKNKHLDLRVVVGDQYPQFMENIEQIQQVYDGYQAYKERNFVMDFDDLLEKSVELLQSNEAVRTKVAAQHRFVMVDEYQDTNKLQATLTQLLSSVHNNVMAVGDDAQSIYAFRGADHRNILEFPSLYENCTLIKLEENYRSTPQILCAANELLGQAYHKFDKQLFSEKEESDLPALVKAASDNEQSRFLTQAILQLREQEIALNDMAVLFRNGRDSFDLEIELNRKNIPFVKFGGLKFTEAAHVKDVLAHVRVLVNPMDTLAWNRILMLIDGIGPKTAQELFEWIRLASNPYALDASEVVSKSYMKQIKGLSKLLIKLNDNELMVNEVVSEIVDYYKNYCEKRYDDYPKRLKDLETFVGISAGFSSLSNMLRDLALDPINATAIDTEQQQHDELPLVLSTIHSAKGLEWEHVFIMQCLDGVIPSSYSVEDEELLDEELRLMYVATTRAKQMLYYTFPAIAQSSYGDYFTKPSRFIENLPDGILEPWILTEEPETPMLDEAGNYLTE
ncbi:MAG: ATP-dependent helicase [Balneolaceae bacterium]|nr:ATP-dependent helicase [Balneolaceae bacterium]